MLAFLMEGVEEIEFVTPVDIWRRAGFEVTVASLGYIFFCASPSHPDAPSTPERAAAACSFDDLARP